MKVLLGITGSVAAVLTPKIVKALKNAGHEVKVVSTDRGLYFFDSTKVETEVFKDMDEWQEGGYVKNSDVLHIDFGKWADVLLIAPLTADTLSDIANGKCDKFLTCIARAWPLTKPMLFAPAMNTNMWEHPVTAEHLKKIALWLSGSLVVIPPIEKRLACGDVGKGAMADIVTIVEEVNKLKV
jgi:phosphopantothenoylcysteine decarboxylase